MTTQPSQINLMVYPQGEAMPVIDFDRLVSLLDMERMAYLNKAIGDRWMEAVDEALESRDG